jgi:hypothetical protein
MSEEMNEDDAKKKRRRSREDQDRIIDMVRNPDHYSWPQSPEGNAGPGAPGDSPQGSAGAFDPKL